MTDYRKQLLTPPVLRLMQIISDAGGEARIVGGAVRDAVLARPIGDIDMAVTLPPEQVMDALTAQSIKCVPTGLAHGTITAVINHHGYEITTLRRDVETNGRHARVEYTDDWQQDAARRDFTMNALYLDAAGAVYDYFDGTTDAKAGHVRFIGDTETRIREDVLRILRFFRFYAWFGRGAISADGLTACQKLTELLPNLSAERVSREIIKLLAAPDPAPTWWMMVETGIIAHWLPEARNIPRLQRLLQRPSSETTSSLARLAALLPADEKTVAAVAMRLKLSNRDAEILRVLSFLPGKLHGNLDPVPLRRLLYAHGPDHVRAALFLVDEMIDGTQDTIETWENPTFPVRGEDLVRAGLPVGPRIGEILRAIEDWWIAGDFRADRCGCLAEIPQYVKNH